MPRVTPLPHERVGWFTRRAYRYTEKTYGRLPEPVAVWAHAPSVLWSTSIFESLVHRTWRRMPKALAELATLRAASVIGCPWCLDFGSLLAKHSGVTEEQLRELHRWESSAAFNPTERLVLAYADAMTTTPMTVTDEMVEQLRAELGDATVVELTALIALENQRSRFNHAMGITAQGFTSGACALPVGERRDERQPSTA